MSGDLVPVVGYLRVSTDAQARDGVSLAQQRERLRLYAALYGLRIVETISDPGVSGKTLNRPGLRRALAMLDSGAARGLLVAKLDRLTRSVRDLGSLLDRYFARADGLALLCVAEQVDTRSAGGRLVLNVLISVAQWERETTAERTRAALQHKRERNEYTGGRAPYGWRIDGGELRPSEPERRAVLRARELRSSGLSLRRVAERIAAEGHRTRTGGDWSSSMIQRLIGARVCE